MYFRLFFCLIVDVLFKFKDTFLAIIFLIISFFLVLPSVSLFSSSVTSIKTPTTFFKLLRTMCFRGKAGYLFIYLLSSSWLLEYEKPGQVIELEQDFPGQEALRELQGSKSHSKCVRLWILTR